MGIQSVVFFCHGSHEIYEDYESHEGWWQSHDKRSSRQDDFREARAQDEGWLRAPCELGSHCCNRGEEDRYLYHPRPLQDQDPREASHQGRSASVFWTGDEGEGQASQDCYQGLPSCSTEGTGLSSCTVFSWLFGCPRDLPTVGIPWSKFGKPISQ